MDHCANPACLKPLRYLREGKVYAFEAPGEGPRHSSGHRLEHYWLCGKCSATLKLERASDKNIRIMPKRLGTTAGIGVVSNDDRKAS
jgi:hypothetical protein